jgi:hypothetical protein
MPTEGLINWVSFLVIGFSNVKDSRVAEFKVKLSLIPIYNS